MAVRSRVLRLRRRRPPRRRP
uniref:Uncharacterized protein n=1 Tax=Arundo donax TaxID=35708 RepID=A0A0A9TPL1_ARUDO